MPGDLRNPEFLYPFHYDSRYDRRDEKIFSNPLDKQLFNIGLQNGVRLNINNLSKLKEYLLDKGLLHRNTGDESFTEEIVKYLHKIRLAKKVIKKCQI